MTPKISICIPVYNVEKHIGECIQSVLNQSFQDFEIIVVNDATPDNSMSVVNSFAKHDNRIKVYSNPENKGLMWTRREGYLKASGDYLCFLDSDDTLPVDALKILYETITGTDADIVCGQIQYITSNKVSLSNYPNFLQYGNDAASAIKSTLKWEITHNLCGKIYRSSLFKQYDYVTYEHVINAEDALLFYQILNHINKIITVSNVVYNYFLHSESSTNSILNDRSLNGIFLWLKYRWDLIINNYPHLEPVLFCSMIKYLTSLAPSLESREIVNKYLVRYGVPFEVNLKSIIKYSSYKNFVKSFIAFYFSSFVRWIRYYRIKRLDTKSRIQ